MALLYKVVPRAPMVIACGNTWFWYPLASYSLQLNYRNSFIERLMRQLWLRSSLDLSSDSYLTQYVIVWSTDRALYAKCLIGPPASREAIFDRDLIDIERRMGLFPTWSSCFERYPA